MRVRDIMTARIVTVKMDDRLSVVKEIFDSTKFHHLLVVDEGKRFMASSRIAICSARSAPMSGQTWRLRGTLQR
jgi:CBS domain-containing protein